LENDAKAASYFEKLTQPYHMCHVHSIIHKGINIILMKEVPQHHF